MENPESYSRIQFYFEQLNILEKKSQAIIQNINKDFEVDQKTKFTDIKNCFLAVLNSNSPHQSDKEKISNIIRLCDKYFNEKRN